MAGNYYSAICYWLNLHEAFLANRIRLRAVDLLSPPLSSMIWLMARRRGAKLVSSLVTPLAAAFHRSATNFNFICVAHRNLDGASYS